MFERHSWPAGRTSNQPASPKENPYEKAYPRFRARYSFRRARFGRQLPKFLHDALVRAEFMGLAAITVLPPGHRLSSLCPFPYRSVGRFQDGAPLRLLSGQEDLEHRSSRSELDNIASAAFIKRLRMTGPPASESLFLWRGSPPGGLKVLDFPGRNGERAIRRSWGGS